ncbi:hypothetical protein [Roseimarinus sediminis]|uniref:hypothetical protein n=1 Tax=Roseimarinus sediminis TaxID=1610899 RepID=UPI003D1E3920
MKIIKLLVILIVSILLYNSCKKDGCELTTDDMDWLLEEYDSLYYLKNGTDTVVAKVISGFGQDEYDWQWGIRTGDNDYYGYSYVIFNILQNNTLSFNYTINACNNNVMINEIKTYPNKKEIHVFYYYLNKDSIKNNSVKIDDKEYTNCFYFSSSEDTVLQELIFSKKYGVVKFKTTQNELFELLPLNLKE